VIGTIWNTGSLFPNFLGAWETDTMKRSALHSLALVALVVVQGQAICQECCPHYTLKWVDQAVTCTKMDWRTRDVSQEILKPVYREEVKSVVREVVVPEWVDEPRDCLNYVLKPREIVKDVVNYMLVPTTVVDPCTGCAHTTCKLTPVVQKVRCTVYDTVPQTTRVMIKVCRYRTEKRNFEHREIHCDWRKDTVTRKEWYCVPVSVTTTVKVPVYVPCP
jgi:hypothetical protein